jgi:hypothetical protein
MAFKTWIQEFKEELVASATLAKLEQMGVSQQRFVSTVREAVLDRNKKNSIPALTDSMKKALKAYGLAQRADKQGSLVVTRFYEGLERRNRNLDRRNPYFKQLFDGTKTWFVEMASFGVVFKGILDLSERQRKIIDIDLQATGRLNGVLKLAVPQMEYEKAAIIGKKFNVDSEHVATSAFEFMNWYDRQATMKDLEYIAAIARHTGQSYDDIWKEIQERTEELGETFEQASYGVQDVISSQHDLERYQQALGTPRENILGAKDFAAMMKTVRGISKDMPKDARVMNKVIVETLKRVTGTVDSKAGQEKVAEGMAKLLEADPLISEQLGISVEKKIHDEASRIIASHGGNFDKSKAEAEAISKMFGTAYSATAQSIWEAYRGEKFDQFQARRDLGNLYSKLPEGAAETLKRTINFATVEHTNPQTLMFYLRDKGVPEESIPAFIKMSTTGQLEQIASELTKLDNNAEAALKNGLNKRESVIGDALPWLSDILGTIRAGKEIILSSPFTKILGGILALLAMNKFRKFQDATLIAGINNVTVKLAEIAVKSNVEGAAALLGSIPVGGGVGRLAKAASLAKKVVSNRAVQAVGAAGVAAGTMYMMSGGGGDASAALAKMDSNAETAFDTAVPDVVNSSTRGLTDRMLESEKESARRQAVRTQPPVRSSRGVTEVNEQDFVGSVMRFGDNKPRIEIDGFTHRYVEAVSKTG